MIETDQSERSVFLQAIEIASAHERAVYLKDACGTNDRLRADGVIHSYECRRAQVADQPVILDWLVTRSHREILLALGRCQAMAARFSSAGQSVVIKLEPKTRRASSDAEVIYQPRLSLRSTVVPWRPTIRPVRGWRLVAGSRRR